MLIKRLLSDFMGLIYPNVCLLCGETLNAAEREVCLLCLFKLPKTNYHKQAENPVEKRFWGKVQVERASACFVFQKQTNIQKLLHQLKYKKNQEIGVVLGECFARELLASDFCNDIDLLVPVPLHKNRFRKRGYNQSECIVQGLSTVLEIPKDTKTLFRAIENPTQTKKSVFERWENTQGIFELANQAAFAGKHILLVDDVLTTGSTLEACVHAVLQAEGARVSVVTLAVS